ncbi:MAG: radical SAM protein [Alphaproteobacteria bacterium]|nr:radical SAM protein [Alphaproteobacteria bacterium]
MKRLEQLLLLSRAKARSARAALPGARGLRPTRLVCRLNDVRLAKGLIRATGEPLSAAGWHDAIASVVTWLGPLRVSFVGGEPAASGRLDELVRYANRLECPTHVVTGGGIEPARAELLVDRGLGAVTVLIGGVDEGTHRAAVGSSLDEAISTLEGFREVRARRKRPVGLYVGVPLLAHNVGSVGAIGGWARQAGADGVLATLPLGEDPPPGASEAIAALGRDDMTPQHLIDWCAGQEGRLHGGLRMELISDGTLLVSSQVAPLGDVREASPQELWEAGAEQIAAARSHPRPWDEVELVPGALFSVR